MLLFQVLDNDKGMIGEEKDPSIVDPNDGRTPGSKQKSGCCS